VKLVTIPWRSSFQLLF